MIDITGVDLKELVKAVYELSAPAGLGFLHFKEGTLSDSDAEEIVGRYKDGVGSCILSMDYVHGRACKFHVFEDNGRLTIHDSWYDHTDDQLRQLLAGIGRQAQVEGREHGAACECNSCQAKRLRERLIAPG